MSTVSMRRAFSLIELVIVVVIIGIIAAIAIPRMSRGATGAKESNLTANLRVLRNAIDLFQTEHEGTYPTAATIEAQLTTYTDISGADNATKDATHIYGPYIRSIPPLPVGAKKGKTGIAAADGASIGWIYDAATGTIKANCIDAEVDSKGGKYNAY
ncbi:MAG: prepilin-type N-terminal cleavage/methylation domain-containing protein [Planctomycetes bacterium]|nr:prepilin-type N-terminal cleavage/methylation domain-containing protein [Planctomycetota bacterium]